MSAYDPKNPGGTRWPPPDLERTLQELRARFRGFRGGGMTAGVGIVVLLILLWSSWFTVQPDAKAEGAPLVSAPSQWPSALRRSSPWDFHH